MKPPSVKRVSKTKYEVDWGKYVYYRNMGQWTRRKHGDDEGERHREQDKNIQRLLEKVIAEFKEHESEKKPETRKSSGQKESASRKEPEKSSERKNSKPWFLWSKKLGDYSHLRWDDFNELRETVGEAVNEVMRRHSYFNWKKIKDAAVTALHDLAKTHHCTSELDAGGGHICIYKNGNPVFALRIGNYSQHGVKHLLKSKALYRGILDVVASVPLPVPKDLAPAKRAFYEILVESQRNFKPLKVLYYLLPTAVAGKWKKKEAYDLLDVIGCVKEHPDFSGRDIQHTLNMSPNKTVRLLDLLKRRRILHRRGASKSSGWYLN